MSNRELTGIEIIRPEVSPSSKYQLLVDGLAGFIREQCAHERSIGAEAERMGLPVIEHQQRAVMLVEEIIRRISLTGATITYPDPDAKSVSSYVIETLTDALAVQRGIATKHHAAYNAYLDEHHTEKGDELDERDLLIVSTFHSGVCHAFAIIADLLGIDLDADESNETENPNVP